MLSTRPLVLLGAATALLVSACLVTDPLEVQPDAGPPENQPVVILESSVTPNNWDVVALTRDSTPPCQQTFRVVASDEDVGDNLGARWFLDCGGPPDASPNWRACLAGEAEIAGTGQALRVGPSLSLTNAAPGQHILKLMVSDGFDAFHPGAAEGRSVASYEWVVDVASECQGTTP